MASSSSPSSNSRTTSGNAFNALGDLIRFLPTSTVFLFQLLHPFTTNKIITAGLFITCAFYCCFSYFTDSYTDSDQQRHYAIVTTKGLWPAPTSEMVDMSKYKLGFGDFAHALFGLLVFSVLALLDTNSVRCFYPEFESTAEILIKVLPLGLTVVSGPFLMLFPDTRHRIGFPLSSSDENNNNQQRRPTTIITRFWEATYNTRHSPEDLAHSPQEQERLLQH